MPIKPIYALAILPLFLWACIDEYWPNVDKYEKLMVIDGMITNEPGPYVVKLSLTSPANEPNYSPLSGCTVSLEDDLGNMEILSETDAGIYVSDSNGMRGIPGRKYKVVVWRPDERQYESQMEELQMPTEIDSVYTEIEYRQDNGLYNDLAGLHFYLDSKKAEKDTSYFMWRAQATYQYQSDFTIRWYYDGTLHWFHGPDSLYNCWKSHPINQFFLQSTRALAEPIINRLPLHYVNTQTRLLSVRYSLLVKQFVINEAAFAYWSNLEEMNTDQASLYTRQPYQTRGNLENINDENETVLGYFLVAAETSKRIFVDRPNDIPFYYPVCTLNDRDFEAYGALHWEDPVYYPIYAIETNGGRRAVPHQDCVDCRRIGGSITKPEFWIDKWE